jgi:protein-S-isoprenylcysteine O-methyltransferase
LTSGLLLPFAFGALPALAVLAAGGYDHPVVVGLAIISALTFGELARRGQSEERPDGGDPTDLLTGLCYLAILIGGAIDASGRPPLPDSWESTLVLLAGVPLIVGGLLLRSWAVREMAGSHHVRLGIEPEQRLVESGPFRRVRHPSYSGMLLLAAGTALSLESPLAFAAAVLLYLPALLVRIRREESLLIGRFGEQYRSYRRRTWRLVPGIL